MIWHLWLLVLSFLNSFKTVVWYVYSYSASVSSSMVGLVLNYSFQKHKNTSATFRVLAWIKAYFTPWFLVLVLSSDKGMLIIRCWVCFFVSNLSIWARLDLLATTVNNIFSCIVCIIFGKVNFLIVIPVTARPENWVGKIPIKSANIQCVKCHFF